MEQILPIFREILELPDLIFEINQRLDIIQRQFDDFRGVDGATVDLSGIDHGALAGLAGDDHPQYHNDSRGDIKYYTKTLLNAGQLNSLYYTETEINAWRNSVTQTEMGYLNGIDSDIQTQLDARCLESIFGTLISTGLLLDGTTLKASAILQKYHAIDPSTDVQSLLGCVDEAAIRTLLDLEVGVDFYSISTLDTVLALKAALASPNFTGIPLAPDHGTAAVDMLINICYGTGTPPVANTTTIGALFIKYTA